MKDTILIIISIICFSNAFGDFFRPRYEETLLLNPPMNFTLTCDKSHHYVWASEQFCDVFIKCRYGVIRFYRCIDSSTQPPAPSKFEILNGNCISATNCDKVYFTNQINKKIFNSIKNITTSKPIIITSTIKSLPTSSTPNRTTSSINTISSITIKNLMLSEPFLKQKFPSKIEPKLTNVSNVSTECLREKDQLKIGISTFSHDYSKELLISRLQLLYELAIRRKYELMNINDIGPDGNSQIVWCSFEDLFGDEKVFTNDIIKKNHEAIWMKFVVVNGTDGVIDSGTVRDTFALLSEQQLSIYLNEETLGNVQLSKNDSTLKRRYQYWIIGAVFGAMIAFFLILWAILAPYYICVRPPVKEQHELNGSWRDPAFLERTMTARRLLSTRIADMSNLQSAKIQDEYLQNLYINSFKKNTETESDDRKNDNWSVNSERIEEISKEEKQRRKKNRKQQKVLPETIRNREMIEQMREKTRYK